MIRNYLTIALRNLLKHRTFTIINVLGLSLGMAAFVLIYQYISFEKSVNQFHRNASRLYRTLYEVSFQGHTYNWESVPPMLAPLAKDQFGEVEGYCRIIRDKGVVSNEEVNTINTEPVSFREERLAYVDGSFFRLFSFAQQEGNTEGLQQPNTVAISQATASKYFGTSSAIGKTLTLNNQFGKTLYTVAAVFQDFPDNSDLQFDLLFSLQTLANPANLNDNEWASLESLYTQWTETYLLLSPNADYQALESKVNAARKKWMPKSEELARLQPMTNIHLPQSLSDYYTTSGNLKFLYILEAIAALILIIAWFNYINLSTAGALKRAKEVGIRKVIGASRAQLIKQFLGESLLINLVAFLIALAIVNLVQGFYNQLVHKNFSLQLLNQSGYWILGTALLLVGSIASGAYTSFALSSFRPSETLKGAFSKSAKGVWLRKSLVVFQFSVSVMLIASTFILYRQLRFMQSQDLGMRLSQLVALPEPEVRMDTTFRQRKVTFMNELSQQSFVKNFSLSGSIPGRSYNYSGGGLTRLNSEAGDEQINYSYTYIDDHYLSLYNIGLLAGKNFTPELCARPWSKVDKLMLNESALKLLGLGTATQAIGQKVRYNKREFEIAGIVKDYHHLSLRKAIDPIVFFPMYNAHYFTVSLSPEHLKENMQALEKLYKQSFPGNPFDYFFVDDSYNHQYDSEQQYGQVFTSASCLAIFIACLGLFGLATFTVEQRTKEIGIRKVMGATVSQISILLSKDFFLLVLIAIIIASPLAWWAMNQWLQEFAYQTEITVWIFIAAGAITSLIAFLTVGSQAAKASLTNPVDSLRTE